MVALKTIVISVVAVFSVSLQSGVRAQPTIDTSARNDSCSHLEEELGFQVTENKRLRKELKNLENERRQQRPQSVTATLISSFSHWKYLSGITQVEDKIYIIATNPTDNYAESIKVHEDRVGFCFVREIPLNGTDYALDIVYSNEAKRIYFTDPNIKRIWTMSTTGEDRMTEWLNNITHSRTLSLTKEGHVLLIRRRDFRSEPNNSLEIYFTNGTLVRRIYLPQDFHDPSHVVQTSTGNFIVGHSLGKEYDYRGPWVISKLTNDGQLIHRFTSRNKSEELYPSHLCLDSDNNRLFVADSLKDRIILFDTRNLTWSQVLLSREANGIHDPSRLYYDVSKKRLFVAQHEANITVYEIK